MALTKISTAMISQDAASVDLNIDAGTLYIDSTNNRVGVANTSPATALDVTGTITADNIKLGDNQRVQIGDDQDFELYTDGSNSYILATGGSGSLKARADSFSFQDSSNINMIQASSSTGQVTLYYNTGSTSTPVLRTEATGINVPGNITTTGYIAGPATFTIDPAAVGDNTGTVVIAGNLQVDGTTTTINSTTVNVDDLNIQLATGAANAAAANGAGITVDGASATITYDGTNDEWDFNKDVNVTGTLTASGGSSNNDSTANILTLNASEHARLVVDTSSTGGHRATLALKSNNNETQLTTTGSASFLNVASGNLTVDVAGDIVLDADGGDIFLRDAGSEFGRFQGSNQDWLIRNDAQDKDILIVGNDGGTVITALTLDMSEAGRATFNDNVNLGDTKKLVFGDGDDLQIYHDASNNYVDAAGVGHLYLQSQGDDRDVKIRSDDGSGGLTEYFRADGSLGQAQLFYYGSKKLHTVTGGIDVTGTVTADGLTVDGDVTVTGASAISLSSVQHITYQTTSTNATAGDHIFKSYNTEIMRIDGNNNRVGIGTTTPQKKFHIEHTAGASEGILISGASDTTGHTAGILLRAEGGESDSTFRAKGGIFFERTGTFGVGKLHLANDIGSDNTSATIADARLTISTDGYVGVGTTTPVTTLHVAGADGLAYLKLTSDSTGHTASDGSRIGLNGSDLRIINAEAATLSLHTSNTQRMVIRSDGELRLDTGSTERPFAKPTNWGYSAAYRVLMLGSSSTTYSDSGTGSTTISMGYDPSGNADGSFTGDGREILFRRGAQFVTPNSANNDFYLYNLVLNDGKVGIGTNSPNSPLHIQADGIGLRFDGSANTQKSILFRSTGVNAPGEVYADGSLRFRTEDANTFIQFHTNSSGTNNERMIIKSDGKIGINQSNPATYLHIKGTSDNQLMIEGDQSSSNVGLFFREAGTDKWELYHRGADNQFTLYSYAAGDRVFVVDPAGKVGIGSSSLDPATSLDVTSAGEGGIRIKPATQIAYTPSSLSNFRQGLTLENAGSGHAFSIGYGQGGWLKFSHFDNSSTYSELARMETSGDFRPAGSVLLNDGEGISFAATGNGNGSNSSELFDDYEEGTWTIVLKDGTGNTYSGTYQSSNGRYTKVGRLVHATFELYVGQVDLTANGLSGNQGVRIAGFPYNSNSSQFSGGVINNSNGINYTANSSICLAMARNVNEVMLRSFLPSTASGESQITVTQFNNGNRLVYGTIMYEAS